MTESGNTPNTRNAVGTRRRQFGPLYFIGLPLMILGIVIASMNTMNHLKQQPPEPLIFDMTLARGFGGFIVYGVAGFVVGFVLMLVGVRRGKDAEQRYALENA